MKIDGTYGSLIGMNMTGKFNIYFVHDKPCLIHPLMVSPSM